MTITETIPTAIGTLVTTGIDVGSSAVKVAVMSSEDDGSAKILALHSERIRRRDLRKVIEECYAVAL